MNKSTIKVLLNAEPFGFGPSAAIASFFPQLRDHFETISYIGKAHTLDLQRMLPYNTVYDLSELSESEENKYIRKVLKKYDLVITAMDIPFAKLALEEGKKTIVYDALFWYWKHNPKILQKVSAYVVQDFFDVKERTLQLSKNSIKIISPIIDDPQKEQHKEHILINLGGLKNPLIDTNILVNYSKILIETIQQQFPSEKIIIATSREISQEIDYANTYSKKEMKQLIAKSKFAFMTPGLGNIYDAVEQNTVTVWLPPANDSQGQQLIKLKQHDMVDGDLDWNTFENEEINYFEKQEFIMEKISSRMLNMSKNKHTQKLFAQRVSEQLQRVIKSSETKLAKLYSLFGGNGKKEFTKIVIDFASSMEKTQ